MVDSAGFACGWLDDLLGEWEVLVGEPGFAHHAYRSDISASESLFRAKE